MSKKVKPEESFKIAATLWNQFVMDLQKSIPEEHTQYVTKRLLQGVAAVLKEMSGEANEEK